MEQNVLERILEGSLKPTHLPLETLRKITDEFSVDRIIGEGGFGTVYKGIVGNRSVAVKRIRSSMTIDQKLFRREVDSLMEVNHPNVVRFLGLCSHTVETPMKNPESKGYIYAEIRERLLCFEYIGNGSLDTKITDELRGLEWDKRYQIIKGICSGLNYLHMEKCILHMDLKPANILLDDQMVPKITDFGLSRPMEYSQTMTTNHFASLGYCAPENLFGGRMSVKSDMYSLGVIIIELVTGRMDIPDKNDILRRWRHRWNKSVKETPPRYHQQLTKCIEIGLLCQKIDPYARPSISEIMREFLETEITDINDKIANESTIGQINTTAYWEDDMLGVEPLELWFHYNKQKKILSCLVELSNDTNDFIAYKIQTTSLLPYSIEPSNDIVKPRSKCSVDISLPLANKHDHEVAHKYSNKQYTEFVLRSIKVNEGLPAHDIFEDMFDKHTARHHVDEIHLVVVSEKTCSKEVIDLPNVEAKKEHTSSGMRPTLIKPGSVQLVIKNNKMAPLLEYEKRVMLELTGGDYSSDRPGLDLVAVLDVSGSAFGEEMLKTAMRFVIRKLSPIDRLSIVTFSHATTKLCPLRQITKASQRELQELIDGPGAFGYGTNIKDGLLMGLEVLAHHKASSGRVAGIMLVSNDNDQHNGGGTTQVTVGNVPVYTFGLGANSSDYTTISTIAANSMGGTFSHIQDEDIGNGGLTIALSQCLASLLTISVTDLELTMAAVGDESRISNVIAGSYPQTKDNDANGPSGSVTVRFGNLYSREVRKVVVNLRLPAIEIERSAQVLKVTYSYISSSSGTGREQFVAPPETLTVWRTGLYACTTVFTMLDDPANLARASAVSRSWCRFVIANQFSKLQCLRVCPEVSNFTHVEVSSCGSSSAHDDWDVGSSVGEKLEWEHRVYMQLSHGLLSPCKPRDCIFHCIGASSTGSFPEETIENTLKPVGQGEMRPSYWSSGGQRDPATPECLIYRLQSDLCLVDEIKMQPFKAFQYRDPIYSAKTIRFQMGYLKSPLRPETLVCAENEGCLIDDSNYIWTYTSPEFPMLQENVLQSFKLPHPVLCIGGVVKIELLGRVQQEIMDGLYYICVSHVQVVGKPLSRDLGVAARGNGLVLSYYPDPRRCGVLRASHQGTMAAVRRQGLKQALLDRLFHGIHVSISPEAEAFSTKGWDAPLQSVDVANESEEEDGFP